MVSFREGYMVMIKTSKRITATITKQRKIQNIISSASIITPPSLPANMATRLPAGQLRREHAGH
jgi:hypothetical protein